MKYEEIFKEFCRIHGYIGKYQCDAETKEYEIIISKGDDNAGWFLEEEEYQELDENGLMELLVFIDRGFKAKFNR